LLTKYDFEIEYCTKKTNLINEFFRCLNYESESNDKICLFTLQNKLKNITIVAIKITLILTRDVRQTLTLQSENELETQILKIEKKFNIELFNKNALNKENTINTFEKKRNCKHSLKCDDSIVASQRRSHRMRQKEQFKNFFIFVVVQNRKVAREELYSA